jgi:adenylate cyclase
VRLARSHTTEEVISSAIDLLFKIEEVHRATVILWDEEQKTFGSRDLHTRDGRNAGVLPESYDPASLVMSRTILNRVRQQNVPLLIRDAKSDAMLDGSVSVVHAGIQAAFCAPLTFQGYFLGIIYADNLTAPDAFSDVDFRTFTSIASQTGLALANVISSQRLQQRELERQALRQYLPPQVADLIIAAGGASQLKGVLQPITVLYADIRGFTTISEQMSAPQVVEMLSEFFGAMSEKILECNGTLDKFIGDCIMALFGAPMTAPTAPHDAVKAAIAMQRMMEALNADRAKRNAPSFEIGIGIHCGPAVVGNIGSADRVQYTAIGDTVNVASRLVSIAAPRQIIVSEDIRSSMPGFDGFTPLGQVELKGRTGTLPIHAVRWTEFRQS